MTAIITLQHVTKRVRRSVLLNDVSLTLQAGKTYGFIGHNGSGKSVLFKLICGFMKPSTGTIMIRNEPLGQSSDFIQNAGVLIEAPNFIQSSTGYQNLKMLAEINASITDEQIHETLQIVGLAAHANKKVGKYSLGMKQRLRIAQAIMENPEILIVDEPFNGLDKQGVADIYDVLLTCKQRGKTILLTSHHERDIEQLCDEVFELANGELIRHFSLSANVEESQ